MKAVLLKDMSYPYATDLRKGDIVDIKEGSVNNELLIEKEQNRLIDRKSIAFLTNADTKVFSIYRNVINLLDKADLDISKRNTIIEGLKEIYRDLKIDIIE